MNNKKELLDIIFNFDIKEFDAIFKQVPMTYELFELCVTKCVEVGALDSFLALMNTYAEFAEKYTLKIEQEIFT